MKKALCSIAVLFALAGVVLAEGVSSGLKEGEAPPAFQVKDVTGPSAGKELCYRCQFGGRPTTAVFTRELNDNVASLVKEVDGVVAKNSDKKAAAFVVYLAEDTSKSEAELKAFAEKNKLTTPLTIFAGAEGPKGYNVSKDASVNVMLWAKSKAVASHAFAEGKLDKAGVEAVIKDTAKLFN